MSWLITRASVVVSRTVGRSLAPIWLMMAGMIGLVFVATITPH